MLLDITKWSAAQMWPSCKRVARYRHKRDDVIDYTFSCFLSASSLELSAFCGVFFVVFLNRDFNVNDEVF